MLLTQGDADLRLRSRDSAVALALAVNNNIELLWNAYNGGKLQSRAGLTKDF